MSAVKFIPDGYHSVTPYLVVAAVRPLIAFLEAAFDAAEVRCMTMPDGRIAHAEVRIGDSIVMMGESSDQFPPRPSTLHLYVEDTDSAYRRAIAAGAESLREPTDQDHGDRMAGITDPTGNQWWIATHQEDVSDDEMRRRAESKGGG